MKVLINALQENPCSKKELMAILENQIPGISLEANRKRVQRFLNKYIALGLVEERGEKYCWYVYFNIFEDLSDYSAKLNHSNLLIPTLEKIGNLRLPSPSERESENNLAARINYDSALDHLRSYKDAWRLLEEYNSSTQKADKQQRELSQTLSEKLETKFGRFLLPPPNGPIDYSFLDVFYVEKTLPSIIHSHIRDYSLPQIHVEHIPDEKDVIYDGNSRIGKGSSLVADLETFLTQEISDPSNISKVRQIENTKHHLSELRSNLGEEVEKIIMKIKNGEPLAGKCKICPQIYFSPRKGQGDRIER